MHIWACIGYAPFLLAYNPFDKRNGPSSRVIPRFMRMCLSVGHTFARYQGTTTHTHTHLLNGIMYGTSASVFGKPMLYPNTFGLSVLDGSQ